MRSNVSHLHMQKVFYTILLFPSRISSDMLINDSSQQPTHDSHSELFKITHSFIFKENCKFDYPFPTGEFLRKLIF